MPKISILLATHNNEGTIGRAIRSALQQTEPDFELIVVNDASTDETHAVVAGFAAYDPRVKLVHLEQNVGAAGARNIALAKAGGDWVTILDGDDWYDSRRLEALLTTAEANDADLVADNLWIHDHARDDVSSQTHYDDGHELTRLTAEYFFDHDNPLRRYPIGYIQPLIRRAFIAERQIAYDRSHRVGEDFVFVSEILLQGARAFLIPGAYYNYIHTVSPTTRQAAPGTHSNVSSVLDLLVRGCDELLDKYGATMDSAARRALIRRRWLIGGSIKLKELRAALGERRPLRAASIALSNPLVLVIIGQNLAEIVTANIRAALPTPRTRRVEPSRSPLAGGRPAANLDHMGQAPSATSDQAKAA